MGMVGVGTSKGTPRAHYHDAHAKLVNLRE